MVVPQILYLLTTSIFKKMGVYSSLLAGFAMQLAFEHSLHSPLQFAGFMNFFFMQLTSLVWAVHEK
jgi:hypothetical protein